MSGLTFDAGGLITLDGGERRVIALLARAQEIGARMTLPATALAHAMRQPAEQFRLSRLVRQPTTHLVPLDGPDATNVGILLAASRTSDISEAHVVSCARRGGEPIVTSDPSGLRRLLTDADQRYQLTQRERITFALIAQTEAVSAADLVEELELPDAGALRPWLGRLPLA